MFASSGSVRSSQGVPRSHQRGRSSSASAMHQASCRRRSSSTRSGGSISASAYARIVSSNVKRGSEPRASVEETSPASRSASRQAATSVDGSAAASSAPSVAPAGNVASTASTCGAGGPSSRTLQSIAARSERWRSGRSGALLVRNARASPSREAVPSTPRTRTRAAASSIARGSPSRARVIRTTEGAFSGVSSNSGTDSRARST